MWQHIANRMSSLFPSRRTLLVVAVSASLGAGMTAGALKYRGADPSKPQPPSPIDARFVALGKTYLSELGRVYGAAWNEGAKSLDSGRPVSEAIKDVAGAWNTGRSALFNRLATPEFSKVVPQGKGDAETTSDERAALARAWRGFAVGLGLPEK